MVEETLIDALSAASARGVEVTVFVSGGEPLALRYPWIFTHHRCYSKGEFRAAGYHVTVYDLDGDQSDWEIKRWGTIIAEGSDIGDGDYYHFDACLLAAEAALRAHVLARLGRPTPNQEGGDRDHG